MKIKFLKEYKFLRGFENDVKLTTVQIFKDAIIDTVEDEVPDEDVQWLIDNGFAEEVKEFGWWKPKDHESYYAIDSFGDITHSVFGDYDPISRWRWLSGDCFKTQGAAERYRDYLQAVAIVRQDEGVLAPELLKIKEDNENNVYCIGYLGSGTLRVNTIDLHGCDIIANAIFFDIFAHAQASLDKHPDEWETIANYDWSRE